MPHFRTCIVCLFSLLLVSCSTTQIAPSITRQEQAEAELCARLRSGWRLLEQVNMPARQRTETLAAYNRDLLLWLRRQRRDSFPVAGYEDVIPAADVPLDSLEERYTAPGLGVPVVGIIPQVIQSRDAGSRFGVCSLGAVHMLTAVLRFTPAGQPELQLIPRYGEDSVRVGRLRYQLAADWSAALETYWSLTRIRNDRWLGLFRPQKLRNTTGLYSIQPYHPGRIPVILTHGLASSANTFDNLVNRLISDPVIRRNYQFCYWQ